MRVLTIRRVIAVLAATATGLAVAGPPSPAQAQRVLARTVASSSRQVHDYPALTKVQRAKLMAIARRS